MRIGRKVEEDESASVLLLLSLSEIGLRVVGGGGEDASPMLEVKWGWRCSREDRSWVSRNDSRSSDGTLGIGYRKTSEREED